MHYSRSLNPLPLVRYLVFLFLLLVFKAWGKEQGLKSPQSPALLHRVEQDYGAFNCTPRQTERERMSTGETGLEMLHCSLRWNL